MQRCWQGRTDCITGSLRSGSRVSKSCTVTPALQEFLSFLLDKAHEELAQLHEVVYGGRPNAAGTSLMILVF